MKSAFIVLVVIALGDMVHAYPRSGTTSFGGIQVKVVVDEAAGTFQIGESKFTSKVTTDGKNRIKSDSKKVGIMSWDETLTATIYLNGGDGGNIEGFQECQCDDVRISIVRLKGDGKRTILKNECAYLDPK